MFVNPAELIPCLGKPVVLVHRFLEVLLGRVPIVVGDAVEPLLIFILRFIRSQRRGGRDGLAIAFVGT